MATQTREPLLTPLVFLQVVLFVVLMPLLPLIIAWRWDWGEAWLYALLLIGAFVVSRWIAARRNPDLIAERARLMRQPDAKPWDKILVPCLFIGNVLQLLVVGLDARGGWSAPVNDAARIAALVGLVIGLALSSYALIENRFFSGVARIQTERGHYVIDSGPYRWMRHPGYAGALLLYLATPFWFSALWALLPSALLVVVLVMRARLEDRMLQAELPGYRNYARRTRYRLLPGVW